MKRELFLQDHWRKAYPLATEGTLDVAEFKLQKPRSCWVGGRLCADESLAESSVAPSAGSRAGARSSWRLEGAGVELEFEFASDVKWRGRPETEFSVAVLRTGDILCIHLLNGTVDEVELLVPILSDLEEYSAIDYGRAANWADFVFAIRSFFRARQFLEASTPTLVPSPGTEPFLEPFCTQWKMGSREQTFYLPTSPEFHLKKLLVAGWPRVFELKTCFRNGELSAHHQPEFLMLEWYRSFRTLKDIAVDVENLLRALTRQFFPERPEVQLERKTMAQLFAENFAGFVLRADTTQAELVRLAEAVGVQTQLNDTWDEVFFRLFLEKIEGQLGQNGPVLVSDFPPSQAALARLAPSGFADRFEIYWRGFEIANAFHELNDPSENRLRFAGDLEKKSAAGFSPVPIDDELLQALEMGLPPSAGIALGVERLFMALFEVELISETRAFPLRPFD